MAEEFAYYPSNQSEWMSTQQRGAQLRSLRTIDQWESGSESQERMRWRPHILVCLLLPA